MIGYALFGYPFPIACHDWRELPEMMGLLRDAAKRKKEGRRREGIEERGQTRKNGKKGIDRAQPVALPRTMHENTKQPTRGGLLV